MKRVWPIAMILTGYCIAQFTGGPQQLLAQARVSLASLQMQIENIVNGNTVVPLAESANYAASADDATNADFATDAGSAVFAISARNLDGVPLSDFAMFSNIEELAVRIDEIDNRFVENAVVVGDSTADAGGNQGLLKFDTTTNTLQVSDGTMWHVIKFDP